MVFPRFTFKKRFKTFKGGFPITGKKYIGIDSTGAFVVVGKTGVKASYSKELFSKAEAHLKRLK